MVLIEVHEVSAVDTADLRRRVLRGGRDVPSLGDEVPAHHVAAYDGPHLVASGNIHADAPGSWRVRGMATEPEHRGRGAGRLVLDALLDHAREHGGGEVWCNARTPARAFYERAGFTAASAEWEDPEIGPHLRMALALGRAG